MSKLIRGLPNHSPMTNTSNHSEQERPLYQKKRPKAVTFRISTKIYLCKSH